MTTTLCESCIETKLPEWQRTRASLQATSSEEPGLIISLCNDCYLDGCMTGTIVSGSGISLPAALPIETKRSFKQQIPVLLIVKLYNKNPVPYSCVCVNCVTDPETKIERIDSVQIWNTNKFAKVKCSLCSTSLSDLETFSLPEDVS